MFYFRFKKPTTVAASPDDHSWLEFNDSEEDWLNDDEEWWLVEKFGHTNFWTTNQNSIEVPKVLEPTNIIAWL